MRIGEDEYEVYLKEVVESNLYDDGFTKDGYGVTRYGTKRFIFQQCECDVEELKE